MESTRKESWINEKQEQRGQNMYQQKKVRVHGKMHGVSERVEIWRDGMAGDEEKHNQRQADREKQETERYIDMKWHVAHRNLVRASRKRVGRSQRL